MNSHGRDGVNGQHHDHLRCKVAFLAGQLSQLFDEHFYRVTVAYCYKNNQY